MVFDGLFQHTERIVQEVGGAGDRDVKLLHGFSDASFSVERLKSSVVFFQDGLFGVEKQAVDYAHGHLQSVYVAGY